MPTDVITDACVASVRGGDRDAFNQLFSAWYARLANHALRLVGDRDTAEDVVQDVLVAVWQRRADLPEAAKMAAYLHTSVRNRALNQLRKARPSRHLALATELETAGPPSIDIELADEELAGFLREALSDLSPRTREVFLLSREQLLTYNEIAAELQISVKTVETLMGRALTALRASLRPRLVD